MQQHPLTQPSNVTPTAIPLNSKNNYSNPSTVDNPTSISTNAANAANATNATNAATYSNSANVSDANSTNTAIYSNSVNAGYDYAIDGTNSDTNSVQPAVFNNIANDSNLKKYSNNRDKGYYFIGLNITQILTDLFRSTDNNTKNTKTNKNTRNNKNSKNNKNKNSKNSRNANTKRNVSSSVKYGEYMNSASNAVTLSQLTGRMIVSDLLRYVRQLHAKHSRQWEPTAKLAEIVYKNMGLMSTATKQLSRTAFFAQNLYISKEILIELREIYNTSHIFEEFDLSFYTSDSGTRSNSSNGAWERAVTPASNRANNITVTTANNKVLSTNKLDANKDVDVTTNVKEVQNVLSATTNNRTNATATADSGSMPAVNNSKKTRISQSTIV
jgi:hypothetical protein